MKAFIVKILEILHLKYFLKRVIDTFVLFFGFIFYKITKRTPYAVVQAFTNIFCLTSGASNDVMASAIKVVSPPYPFSDYNGLLGNYLKSDVENVSHTIHKNGYYVFPTPLSERLWKGLYDIGTTAQCTYADENIEGAPVKRAVYNEKNPLAIRYFVPAQTLLNNAIVQEIISDRSIVGLAQEYIGSKPILDHLSMWWSTAINKGVNNKAADDEAAQTYHFDLDRIRWLKFFFYLTDVGPENGPHCYISNTHKRYSVPGHVMRRGYVRLSDDEMRNYFPKENFIEFVGKKGTIIAEDTRGLHKGKHVDEGHRLLFQVQFTNSLFAGSFEREAKLTTFTNPNLERMSKKYPKIYSYYS